MFTESAKVIEYQPLSSESCSVLIAPASASEVTQMFLSFSSISPSTQVRAYIRWILIVLDYCYCEWNFVRLLSAKRFAVCCDWLCS